MEQTEKPNLEPETRKPKPETRNPEPETNNLQTQQHLQAHRHGPHSNFYDPNNPIFDKDQTEERTKQILSIIFVLSAIIFVIWWILATF